MFYVDNFWHTDTWLNFPSPAYFTLFVDLSTENQLNIIFVCMVAYDNINFVHKFIVLNSGEDWILIHNLHVLKSYSSKEIINEVPQKGRHLCTGSLNYLLKKLWETGTTDWQPGSGRLRTSRTAENIDTVNDLALSQVGAPGTHKTTRQIAREIGILQRSVGRIVHKDI